MLRVNLLNVFGYLSYFFVFIMLIEPKTTPVKFPGKVIFGASVGALIYLLIQANARFDVELFILLVMNLTVFLLNKIGKADTRRL